MKFDTSSTFTGYSDINKKRFTLTCIFCKIKYGSPIQCDEKRCYCAYHPLCARKNNLQMTYDEEKQYLISYCPNHSVEFIDTRCEICKKTDDEDNMLLCDECDKGYHLYCINMKQKDIPEGNWYCENCIKKKKLLGQIVELDNNDVYILILIEKYKNIS